MILENVLEDILKTSWKQQILEGNEQEYNVPSINAVDWLYTFILNLNKVEVVFPAVQGWSSGPYSQIEIDFGIDQCLVIRADPQKGRPYIMTIHSYVSRDEKYSTKYLPYTKSTDNPDLKELKQCLKSWILYETMIK